MIYELVELSPDTLYHGLLSKFLTCGLHWYPFLSVSTIINILKYLYINMINSIKNQGSRHELNVFSSLPIFNAVFLKGSLPAPESP